MKNAVFKHILSVIMVISVVACDQPNPEPEKIDPVYEATVKKADEAEKAVAAAKKELDGFRADLEKVAPQTGQIKYAQKRVWDTEAKIIKLEQMARYWKIRSQSRVQEARESYMKAYKAKKPWPPAEEIENFKSQLAAQEVSRHWNVQERIEKAAIPKAKEQKSSH